jgi:hypothetical protein
MSESKFDRQLKQLLSTEVEDKVDGLPDDEDEQQDLDPMLPVQFEDKESAIAIDENPDLEADYKFARSNYYGLIGRTNAAIDLILNIAQMSEHPRAIEVAANLMKTSSDVTKDLLALQKSVQDKQQRGGGDPKGKYTQHNHFYGDKSPKDIDNELDGLDDEKKNTK